MFVASIVLVVMGFLFRIECDADRRLRVLTGPESPVVQAAGKAIHHIDALRRILFSPHSYVRSIFPEPWLRRMTTNKQTARASFRVLYAILTLEIWHKLFLRDQLYTKPGVNTVDLFEIPQCALSV